MIRILFFILLILVISTLAIWTIDNNGYVEISWLDHLVKTDILTAIIIIFVTYCILAVLLSFLSSIFKFRLSVIKKIFSPNKLKSLNKLLQKDEESFEVILDILKDLENANGKEALKKHKSLAKICKNKDLNNFLLAKIHNQNGDVKKAEQALKSK